MVNFLDRSENLIRSIKESHRIVILLTSDFIKDNWSLFSFQSVSFLNYFSFKKIFVLT